MTKSIGVSTKIKYTYKYMVPISNRFDVLAEAENREELNTEELTAEVIVSDHFKPYLIAKPIFDRLSNTVLTLMPSERNVMLTMKFYDLEQVNPLHNKKQVKEEKEDKKVKEAKLPTHVIIFCLRVLANKKFQPIGAVLINRFYDQTNLIAECIRTYIQDLWKMNLYVVATMSPPRLIFKKAIGKLIKTDCSGHYSEALSYSVEPFKDIIHLYDFHFLLKALHESFEEHDIRFQTTNKRTIEASWDDVLLSLNLSKSLYIIKDVLAINRPNEVLKVHLFTDLVVENYLMVKNLGYMSEHADGFYLILKTMTNFLNDFQTDCFSPTMLDSSHWSDIISYFETMEAKQVSNFTLSRRRNDMENEFGPLPMAAHENLQNNSTQGESSEHLDSFIAALSRIRKEIKEREEADQARAKDSNSASWGEPSTSKEGMEDFVKFEKRQIFCEWAASIKGVCRLLPNFTQRRLRNVSTSILYVEHIDFLVSEIHKEIDCENKLDYVGIGYTILDQSLMTESLTRTNIHELAIE